HRPAPPAPRPWRGRPGAASASAAPATRAPRRRRDPGAGPRAAGASPRSPAGAPRPTGWAAGTLGRPGRRSRPRTCAARLPPAACWGRSRPCRRALQCPSPRRMIVPLLPPVVGPVPLLGPLLPVPPPDDAVVRVGPVELVVMQWAQRHAVADV